MPTNSTPAIAEAMLSIVDGDQKPFADPILMHIHNGQDVAPLTVNATGPDVLVQVPFHNGIGDFYAISVSSQGYRDSGCFFTADPMILAEPKLLLLRSQPTPQFAPWGDFKNTHPTGAAFLSIGQTDAGGASSLRKLGEEQADLAGVSVEPHAGDE